MSKQLITLNYIATGANSKYMYIGVEEWRYLEQMSHSHTPITSLQWSFTIWVHYTLKSWPILQTLSCKCKAKKKKATQLEAQSPWIANSRHFFFLLCWSHLDSRRDSWDFTTEAEHKAVCCLSLTQAFFFPVQKKEVCTAGWHLN